MVVIEVRANPALVANAGSDQTVSDGNGDGTETVLLDGSASIDPVGGTIVWHLWSEGGTAIGSGATLAIGTHDIVLTVTDNGGATASDTVTVTVTANQAPVADAGPDQTITDNDGDGAETVVLDGSASTDPGGAIVSYEWTEAGVVVGSSASVTVTREVGAHGFTLTVTDAAGVSASDEIAVTVNPDPYADKVVLMTHLDGPDGATTAIDESSSSHPLTLSGAAEIDTAESRFGGASAMFDDLSTTYILAPDSDDWHFGAGEFTVEGWVRFYSLASYSSLIHQFSSTNNQISWLIDWTTGNQLRFLYSPDGSSSNMVVLAADWTPTVGQWHHIAVDRDASQRLRIYVDGNVLHEAGVSASFHNSSHILRFGVQHAGSMDEVRITKGVAWYAGPFTPLDQPHPDSGTSIASAD